MFQQKNANMNELFSVLATPLLILLEKLRLKDNL